MRKQNESPLRLKVIDAGREGRRRKLEIEIDAPADRFELVDVLARYEAVEKIEEYLHQGVEALLLQYFEQGFTVLREASRSRSQGNSISTNEN